MDRRIKLRHLETFVEISRRSSLKRAADALNLTQPAVSKTLRELEETLGAALMTRDRGGVRMTPMGEIFLQHAQASLGALEQGLAGVARMKSGEAARVMVGALPSVAARVLPRASLLFADLAQDSLLFFEDGPHDVLMDRLRRGALDLVVGRLGPPASMAGVSFTQLYTETVICVVRPGHPLTEGIGGFADLADWPVIYPAPRSAIRPLVDRLMLSQGLVQIQARVESVSGAFGREVVRSGDAVWFISEGVVAADVAAGTLARLPLDTGLTAGPVGIMTRAEEEPSETVRLFRQCIRRAASDLGL